MWRAQSATRTLRTASAIASRRRPIVSTNKHGKIPPLGALLFQNQPVSRLSTHANPHRTEEESLHDPTSLSSSTEATTKKGAKDLFRTLKAYNSMPQNLLIARQQQHQTTSWRDADIFQGYKRGQFLGGGSSWGSASAAASALEPDDDYHELEDLREEQEENYHEDPKVEEEESCEDQVLLEDQTKSQPSQLLPQQQQQQSTTWSKKQASNNNDTRNNREQKSSQQKEAEYHLQMAMKKFRNPDRAIQIFQHATFHRGMELSLDLVMDFFDYLTYSHPFHAYEILHYILARTQTDVFEQQQDSSPITTAQQTRVASSTLEKEQIAFLYRRMCIAVRLVDPVKNLHSEIRTMVSGLSSELKQLHIDIQEECYPHLVTSLVTQRSADVGRWAWHLYAKMSNMELDLPPKYFQHLLTCAKYSRMDNLPYHDVLHRTVQGGFRPLPHIVLTVVENMFPYTPNIQGSHVALDAVLELQRQTVEIIQQQQEEVADIERQVNERLENSNGDIQQQKHVEKELMELKKRLDLIRPPHSYVMGMSTLEYMADAAARHNHVEFTMLIWDALDLFGMEPTKDIYESTVLCFAKNPHLCDSALVVLNDMEEKGYKHSSAFVRSLTTALLRSDPRCMERVNGLLDAFVAGEEDTVQFTPSLLNIVLSAHAWRGNVDSCLSLLEMFQSQGWSPSIDSFTFVLESVGKATRRLVDDKLLINPNKKQYILDSYLATVESILGQLEETQDDQGNPIALDKRFIRNYIEFLCLIDDVKTAGLVVIDFLEQTGRLEQLVDNKTLLRVAVAHASKGDYDLARQFAASTSEVLPFIDAKIDKIEAFQNREQPDAAGEDSHAATLEVQDSSVSDDELR
ncbi:expressed unknown protein [Seminavis robusta]|uniref:Pentatricopeptide repeat-containing protein n=1 Tax=Seminavis robusta TaxID=568900 RepID=A0A9N8H2Q5_9STRA|nr:expressed unknown protein [Seminavis robusta]|eukprot:Sro13_g009780.1 n/a (856) ;mRNA; r:28523-31210